MKVKSGVHQVSLSQMINTNCRIHIMWYLDEVRKNRPARSKDYPVSPRLFIDSDTSFLYEDVKGVGVVRDTDPPSMSHEDPKFRTPGNPKKERKKKRGSSGPLPRFFRSRPAPPLLTPSLVLFPRRSGSGTMFCLL